MAVGYGRGENAENVWRRVKKKGGRGWGCWMTRLSQTVRHRRILVRWFLETESGWSSWTWARFKILATYHRLWPLDDVDNWFFLIILSTKWKWKFYWSWIMNYTFRTNMVLIRDKCDLEGLKIAICWGVNFGKCIRRLQCYYNTLNCQWDYMKTWVWIRSTCQCHCHCLIHGAHWATDRSSITCKFGV